MRIKERSLLLLLLLLLFPHVIVSRSSTLTLKPVLTSQLHAGSHSAFSCF